MFKKFTLPEFGYEVIVGKFATQADGAVWLQHGGTVILATVVSGPSKEFPGFLPLTVDYRENFSAAGKIPGGYYKREGRPSEKEILTSRLIDRAIRPLFPSTFFDQIQLLSTVYSVDKEHAPNVTSLVASSLALCISKIPFLGPVGVVEIARVDNKWVINPIYSDSLQADVRFVVAGTDEGICMVEGLASELPEAECVDVLFMAHDKIKTIIEWQKKIQKEIGVQKEEAANDEMGWSPWERRINEFLTDDIVRSVFIKDKVERGKRLKELRDSFNVQYEEKIKLEELSEKIINYIFDNTLTNKITELIFVENKRIDDRTFDQIRHISVEVGLLPFTHGSAFFTRGRTQALASVTLGGGQDEQRIEGLMGEDISKNFMLHYNFPSFSVGEVRPMRGPGRREVGHGNLAASALKYVLPSKDEFPYTIRIVADMLESDGSTSMATTCCATMGLMNAGVPIKKMVSGIAMGLLKNSKGDVKVLSDISGIEDAFGLMDFKVTGTKDGITAIQLDIKHKGGFSRDIFETALDQARKGRLHILSKMQEVMDAPSPELSPLVPKLVTLKIDTDKIGAIIGTGGKTIREIIEKTKTNIDIESDGLVKVFGSPGADIDMAINWIKTLAGKIDKGSIYHGKIRRFVDFGMFVELVPGQDGLVHISNIPQNLQRIFMKHFKIGDLVDVEVVEYDEVTGRIRLRLLEKASAA